MFFLMTGWRLRRGCRSPLARPGELPRGLGGLAGVPICRIIRQKSRCTVLGEAVFLSASGRYRSHGRGIAWAKCRASQSCTTINATICIQFSSCSTSAFDRPPSTVAACQSGSSAPHRSVGHEFPMPPPGGARCDWSFSGKRSEPRPRLTFAGLLHWQRPRGWGLRAFSGASREISFGERRWFGSARLSRMFSK